MKSTVPKDVLRSGLRGLGRWCCVCLVAFGPGSRQHWAFGLLFDDWA